MSKMFCLQCGKEVEWSIIKCPYCGFEYDKFMNTPTKEPKSKLLQQKPTKEKKPMFTNAEALALGIYPNESYKRAIMLQMYDEK